MAALRIQRKPVKGGFQYLCGGERVGAYRRRRCFSAWYRAATFRDGREKYVLRGFDPRAGFVCAALLLALLLPGAPQGVFGAAVIAALLIFPRPPAVWENGRLLTRRTARRRFLIGPDCYELCAHTGFKESLVKNGRQIALYQRRTAWGTYDPPYDVLYSPSADPDLLVLFCLYLDVTDIFTQSGWKFAPWRDFAPLDRHPERAEWRPPEDETAGSPGGGMHP